MTKRALFISLVLLLFTALANADTIGPDCSSCFGSTYTLTYAAINNSTTDYEIHLVIDTTGYTGDSSNLLNSVAAKVVSSSTDITSFDLVSVSGTGNNLSDWSTVLGGLNANGCSSGAEGFICSGWDGTGYGLPVGGIYDWTWDITVGSASDLLLSDMGASVKALYVDDTGKQAGLTSEPITLQPGEPFPPVPEPASLLLLGSGLLGGGALLRRKAKKS